MGRRRESAKFAKDIAAFANSRDGGVIVVGKEEPSPGQFVLKGLTPQQADSFDSTKVAAWINNRFSPPIRLVCHRQEHDGRAFIVITVAEFDDVPVMCIKSYQDPQNAKTILLRSGRFTCGLPTPNELHLAASRNCEA